MTYHSGNQMIDPQIIFEKAQLREGMHVADLGCGRTGHIVFPCAMRLGEMGIIYAVDVLKDVLENIQKRARMDGLLNIQPVWADLEKIGSTSIPARSLDVAFLVNMLVQAKDRKSVLEEAKRLLKDKARLIIVDWERKGLPFGPDNNRFINFEEVKHWARSNKMAVQEEFAMGSFHHGVVLFKQD